MKGSDSFHFFTKIDSISTDELEKRLKSNIQLIDVRTPSEFRRGHIKEAQNIPLSQIGQFAPAKKETIYVICHSGMRSKMAAKKLKKKELQNLINRQHKNVNCLTVQVV